MRSALQGIQSNTPTSTCIAVCLLCLTVYLVCMYVCMRLSVCLVCPLCLDWLLKAKVKNATHPRAAAVQQQQHKQQLQQQLQPQLQRKRELLLAYQVRCRFLLFGCFALHGRKPIQCRVAALLLREGWKGAVTGRELPDRAQSQASIRICFRCSLDRSIAKEFCSQIYRAGGRRRVSQSQYLTHAQAESERRRVRAAHIHTCTLKRTHLLPTYLH